MICSSPLPPPLRLPPHCQERHSSATVFCKKTQSSIIVEPVDLNCKETLKGDKAVNHIHLYVKARNYTLTRSLILFIRSCKSFFYIFSHFRFLSFSLKHFMFYVSFFSRHRHVHTHYCSCDLWFGILLWLYIRRFQFGTKDSESKESIF